MHSGKANLEMFFNKDFTNKKYFQKIVKNKKITIKNIFKYFQKISKNFKKLKKIF